MPIIGDLRKGELLASKEEGILDYRSRGEIRRVRELCRHADVTRGEDPPVSAAQVFAVGESRVPLPLNSTIQGFFNLAGDPFPARQQFVFSAIDS